MTIYLLSISISICEAHSLCEALSLSPFISICEAHSLCEALSLSPFISISLFLYFSISLFFSHTLKSSLVTVLLVSQNAHLLYYCGPLAAVTGTFCVSVSAVVAVAPSLAVVAETDGRSRSCTHPTTHGPRNNVVVGVHDHVRLRSNFAAQLQWSIFFFFFFFLVPAESYARG